MEKSIGTKIDLLQAEHDELIEQANDVLRKIFDLEEELVNNLSQ